MKKLFNRKVGDRFLIGTQLVVSNSFLYRRINQKLEMHTINWLRDQSSYCLDAPEEMPAGSCFGVSWQTPVITGSQTYQTTLKRESQGLNRESSFPDSI